MNPTGDVAVIGDTYRADGVVHVPGAFADWVEPLRAGVDTALATPGVHTRRLSADDAPAPVTSDILRWRDIAPFERFVRAGGVAALAASASAPAKSLPASASSPARRRKRDARSGSPPSPPPFSTPTRSSSCRTSGS